MESVKLKDGNTELESFVAITCVALEGLAKKDPVALWELWGKAKNEDHSFWRKTKQKLIDVGLLQPGGEMHSSMRHVVLNAIVPRGGDFALVDPRAEPPQKGPGNA